MLFVTGTTLSVPSLMGAIMAIGVASANTILLVTFANEQRRGRTRTRGRARRRPDPAAAGADDGGGDDRRHAADGIGLGEGGEQNAALARAVIGGMLVGTITTLLFVPFLYATLRDGKVTKGGVFKEQFP